MPMTLEAVKAQVELFLGEIQETITDDLLDVEFIVCESREAAVIRLNALLDPSEPNKVVLDEIPPDAKGIFFGDPAETVSSQDNDGETDETIDMANGAIVLLCHNLHDADEVDIVLLHEIGHALGLDEDEVDALGLGMDEETEAQTVPESSESPATPDASNTTPEPVPEPAKPGV